MRTPTPSSLDRAATAIASGLNSYARGATEEAQITPIYGYYPHAMSDQGVITWDLFLEDFAMVCYKFEPQDNPYWQENMWMEWDPPYFGGYMVIAGAYGFGQPPQQGAVIIENPSKIDPCHPRVLLTPFQDGPMQIVAAQGRRFLLRSANHGRYVQFDLDTSRFLAPYSGMTPVPTEWVTPAIDRGS